MKDKHNSDSLRPAARREGRARHRRGYTLILVLGLTTVMSALGLTYLDTTSTVMPEAVNHMGSTRAQYLAGSGVALGSHFLMYPQTTVPYGQYWTGGTNIAIDGTTDFVDVAVLRADAWTPAVNDPNRYRITATGVAKGFDGSIRAKRTVITDVQVPKTGQWEIMQGLVMISSATLPSQVGVTGDIHCNGNLTSYGWSKGEVTATGTALWLGTGPPSSVQSGVASVSAPSSLVDYYTTYMIQGKSYTAYTGYAKADMAADDALALNAIDMSATNPGRIIITKGGTFKIKKDVVLNGTLVVQAGQLKFENVGSRSITAVSGFPALVVDTSGMQVMNDDVTLNVTGSVICDGLVDVSNCKRFNMNVTGATIMRDAPIAFGSASTCQFNWDAARATFWDFQNLVPPKPITVLSWKEQ